MTSDPDSPYILAKYHGDRPPAPAWFGDALAQVPQRSFFSSQGTNIELLTWGEVGMPGLLFLPGNGAHADWWSAIAPFFAHERRCASLSWSGMGRSERRPEGYVVRTFVQEARDAIAAAGLDRGGPTIIVGHSMGGMLGVYATAGNPAVGGLIVIDAPIGMTRDSSEHIREHAPKGHPAHRPFASLNEGLARFRLSPPQPCVNDYMVDHIARGGLVEDSGQWFWHFDPRRISHSEDGYDLPLDRIACPMAFLYGDRSALFDAKTLASTLAILPPHTPVVPIVDSAHHIPLDQPLALVAALRALFACWPAAGHSWTEIAASG